MDCSINVTAHVIPMGIVLTSKPPSDETINDSSRRKKIRHIAVSQGILMQNFRPIYESVAPGRAKNRKITFFVMWPKVLNVEKIKWRIWNLLFESIILTLLFAEIRLKVKKLEIWWFLLNIQRHLAAKLCKIEKFSCDQKVRPWVKESTHKISAKNFDV